MPPPLTLTLSLLIRISVGLSWFEFSLRKALMYSDRDGEHASLSQLRAGSEGLWITNHTLLLENYYII